MSPKGLRGKPHPDQIIKVVQKYKISKEIVFMLVIQFFDKGQQQKSKINFIFAKYGYKIGIKKYKYSIKKYIRNNGLNK